MLRLAILICWVLAALVSLSAQVRPPSAQDEFIVLRTDRVAIPEGQTTGLNCSIVGSGNAAQISCESYSSGCDPQASENGPYGSAPCELGTGLGRKLGTRPSIYHVALVVGSNHVGYLVSCSSGGLIRKGCQPLATGQVLTGFVQGDKLSLFIDDKARKYTVEKSAYIGPLADKSGSPKESNSAADDVSSNEPNRASQTRTADLATVTSPLGDSGRGFLTHCDGQQDEITKDACKLWVDGFLNGLAAGIGIATPEGSDPRKNDVVCFTTDATYGRVFHVIVGYIRVHPGDQNQPTAALAVDALQEAYPCKR